MPAWPARARARAHHRSPHPRGWGERARFVKVAQPVVHNLLTGVVAAGCAFAVMTGVAALGLHLAGAGAHGSLVPMTAAVVALAVGGTASLSADLGAAGPPAGLPQGLFGGEGLLGAAGGIDLMPLGVTLAGAVTLAAAFLLPLRGRPPLGASGLAVRVGAAAATSLAFLIALPVAGRGTVSLGDLQIGPRSGGATAVTALGYHAEAVPTVSTGLLWVLAALAVGWLALRSVPLPFPSLWLERTVRPAVSAVVTTTVTVALLVTLLAMVPVASGAVAPEVAGAALLATPNMLVVALTTGLGVPWSGGVEESGALSGLLASRLADLPGEGGTFSLSLASLPASGPGRWLLPVAAALLVLLPCGVLTAARARGRELRARRHMTRVPGRMRRALLRARDLGAAMAVAFPALTALGGISGHLGISVFGRELVAAGVALHGSVPLAAALGALCGAAAGFLGSLLLDAVSDPDRSEPPPGRPAPGTTATPPRDGGTHPSPHGIARG